jgi:hypothetical protein
MTYYTEYNWFPYAADQRSPKGLREARIRAGFRYIAHRRMYTRRQPRTAAARGSAMAESRDRQAQVVYWLLITIAVAVFLIFVVAAWFDAQRLRSASVSLRMAS